MKKTEERNITVDEENRTLLKRNKTLEKGTIIQKKNTRDSGGAGGGLRYPPPLSTHLPHPQVKDWK